MSHSIECIIYERKRIFIYDFIALGTSIVYVNYQLSCFLVYKQNGLIVLKCIRL